MSPMVSEDNDKRFKKEIKAKVEFSYLIQEDSQYLENIEADR